MSPRSRDDLRALLGRTQATDDTVLTQRAHDAAHPGMTCQSCPREVVRRQKVADIINRPPSYYRRRTVVRLVLWFTVSGLLGWFAHDIAQAIGVMP